MKAKEIAQMVRADRSEGSALQQVCGMIDEAVTTARVRKSDGARMAVFRESFQKWRAVCRELSPDEGIQSMGVCLYPKAMQVMSRDLFAACVQGGAFMSYELDDEDRRACVEAHKAEEERERERLARARFNALFGSLMRGVFS